MAIADSRTGHGATITIPGNIAATLTRIGEQVFGSSEAIEDWDLSQTGRMMKYLPPDYYTHEFWEADVVIKGDEIDSWLLETAGNGLLIVGTITLQVPYVSGEATGGSLTGSGWVSQCTIGELMPNRRWEGSLQFHWDGVTGPTWTDVAAAPP